MGKIVNAIQMLNYLNTGNKYSVYELSLKLGITERMVRYYKKELEEAGVPIETFMGPNGGYYIVNSQYFYNCFNKYDIELLENISSILMKNNYVYNNKLKELIEKIKISYDIIEDKSKYFLTSDICDNKNLYNIFNDAIASKNEVSILYRNLNQEWQERKVQPIQIFEFKGEMYLTAFCELRKDIRHFEFSRIKLN